MTRFDDLRSAADRLAMTIPRWMQDVVTAAASCTEDEAGHRLCRWGRDWIRDDLRDVRMLSAVDLREVRARLRDPASGVKNPAAATLAVSMVYRRLVRRSETIRMHRARFHRQPETLGGPTAERRLSAADFHRLKGISEANR